MVTNIIIFGNYPCYQFKNEKKSENNFSYQILILILVSFHAQLATLPYVFFQCDDMISQLVTRVNHSFIVSDFLLSSYMIC